MSPNAIPALKWEPVRKAPSRRSPRGPRIDSTPWGLHTLPSHRPRSSSSLPSSSRPPEFGIAPPRPSGAGRSGAGVFPRPGGGEATRGPSASAPRAARRGGPTPAGSELPAGRRARLPLRPRRGGFPPRGGFPGRAPHPGRRRRPKRRPDAGEAKGLPSPSPFCRGPARARTGPRSPWGAPPAGARPLRPRAAPPRRKGTPGRSPPGDSGKPLAPPWRRGQGTTGSAPAARPAACWPAARPAPMPTSPAALGAPDGGKKQQGGGPGMSPQDAPGPPPCCPGFLSPSRPGNSNEEDRDGPGLYHRVYPRGKEDSPEEKNVGDHAGLPEKIYFQGVHDHPSPGGGREKAGFPPAAPPGGLPTAGAQPPR